MSDEVGTCSLALTNADRAHAEQAVKTWHNLRGYSIEASAGTAATVHIREQGVDLPVAPDAALKDPKAAGNVENGAHDYAFTFVTANGESPVGALKVVTVADKTDNGQVSVPMPEVTDERVTSIWIYRSAAGAHVLKRLHQVTDLATASYLDNVADGSLTNTQPPVTNETGDLIRSVALAAASGGINDVRNDGPWGAALACEHPLVAILTAGTAAAASVYGTSH